MSSKISNQIIYREVVLPEDPNNIRSIIESSGFFYPDEVDIAVELANERLDKGIDSGYHFLFAERGERVVGYSCFGHIAGTGSSYDLYWIAVHQEFRGQGLGKLLLQETEKAITAKGGTRIYIETSSRPQYEPTRVFYQNCGYIQDALLTDFYYPGDSKVIYVKTTK